MFDTKAKSPQGLLLGDIRLNLFDNCMQSKDTCFLISFSSTPSHVAKSQDLSQSFCFLIWGKATLAT